MLALLLCACGGGGGTDSPSEVPSIVQFGADRSSYFVGERAQLTARFENGTARIEPGGIPVQDGQSVTSLALGYGPNEVELIVSDGVTTATRKLTLNGTYRDRMRTIEVPFARGEHAALRLADGRVLVAGGEDASGTLPASLWVFDPATERFADFGATLSTGRVGFTATRLNDGTVLVAGGERGLTAAPSAEIIRPADRTVIPTASEMQRSRTFAAATLLADGRVCLSGGTGLAAGDTVEIYDPATGRFTLLAGRLSFGRYAHTATPLDGSRVLIYGGFTASQQPAPPEIYDVATGTSTPLPAIEAHARGNHVAHRMPDGSVLIIGGEDGDATTLTSVVRFDPATGLLAPFASLATPRALLALGQLADARLLLVGGNTGQPDDDVTNTTETLAADATRRDGPVMSRARWLHTATPLVDGRLLILGGLDADRRPIAGAEVYE